MINVLMIEDDSEFASLLSEYLIKFNIKVTNFEDPYLGLSAGVKKFRFIDFGFNFAWNGRTRSL